MNLLQRFGGRALAAEMMSSFIEDEQTVSSVNRARAWIRGWKSVALKLLNSYTEPMISPAIAPSILSTA